MVLSLLLGGLSLAPSRLVLNNTSVLRDYWKTMRRSSVGSLAEERLESTTTLIPSALFNLRKVKVGYPDTAVKYEKVLLRILNDYFDVRQMSLGLTRLHLQQSTFAQSYAFTGCWSGWQSSHHHAS